MILENQQAETDEQALAAIRSIMGPAAPPASTVAPVKDAKIKILRLLKQWPQPNLHAIAGRIGLTERAAKSHLQSLFYSRMIAKPAALYKLTIAGRRRLDFEDFLIGRKLLLKQAARSNLEALVRAGLVRRRYRYELTEAGREKARHEGWSL